MKKILSIVCAVSLLFVLAGCEKETEATPTPSNPNPFSMVGTTWSGTYQSVDITAAFTDATNVTATISTTSIGTFRIDGTYVQSEKTVTISPVWKEEQKVIKELIITYLGKDVELIGTLNDTYDCLSFTQPVPFKLEIEN